MKQSEREQKYRGNYGEKGKEGLRKQLGASQGVGLMSAADA